MKTLLLQAFLFSQGTTSEATDWGIIIIAVLSIAAFFIIFSGKPKDKE